MKNRVGFDSKEFMRDTAPEESAFRRMQPFGPAANLECRGTDLHDRKKRAERGEMSRRVDHPARQGPLVTVGQPAQASRDQSVLDDLNPGNSGRTHRVCRCPSHENGRIPPWSRNMAARFAQTYSPRRSGSTSRAARV